MDEEVVVVTTSRRGRKVKQPLEASDTPTKTNQIRQPKDVFRLFQVIGDSTTAVIVDSLGFPLLATCLAKVSRDFSLILRLRGEGTKEYREEVIAENIPQKLYAGAKIASTRLGSGGIDGCIPVSKHVKQEGISQGLCKPGDPVVATPVLVDVNTHSPRNIQISGNKVEVAIVTNFDFWNKVKSLPSLLSHKRWKTASFNPRITVYGDGEYLNRIESKVHQDFVKFSGFEKEIHQKLDCSDVFLYATEQDGYPSTVVEAQYHGLPVVANRYGPIPEQVTHRHDGLLYSLDDMGEAVDLVEEVVHDQHLYTRISQNSHRTACMRNGLTHIGDLLSQSIAQIRNRTSPTYK